jgi:CBS domain-containing protein
MLRDAGKRGGPVGDWMSRAPMAVSEDTPIRVAMAHMQSAEIRHLLVMDGPVLTGIVSNRDLKRLVTGDLRSPLLSGPVRSIMSEGPVTASAETPVVVAARLLLEQRIGALPIREGEHIVGIFTVADALDALLAMVDNRGDGES